MAEFPALPLWTDAYLADTGHLTTIEHGAYLLLLITMWRAGGALPNDDRLLAKYCRLTKAQWLRIRPTIIEFFHIDGDEIMQGRLTETIEAVRRRSKQQSNNARSKLRKNKRSQQATAEPNDSQNEASKTKTKTKTKDNPLTPFDGKRFGNPVLALQAAVDPMTAKRFADHCEQKRKRLSVEGAGAIAQELLRYRAEGGNPVEAIELAIRRGWATIELEWLRRHNSETKSNGMSYEIPGKLSAENEAKLRAWPFEKWKTAIEIARDSGQWNPLFGPKPGEPGCLVPAEFLGEIEQGGSA